MLILFVLFSDWPHLEKSPLAAYLEWVLKEHDNADPAAVKDCWALFLLSNITSITGLFIASGKTKQITTGKLIPMMSEWITMHQNTQKSSVWIVWTVICSSIMGIVFKRSAHFIVDICCTSLNSSFFFFFFKFLQLGCCPPVNVQSQSWRSPQLPHPLLRAPLSLALTKQAILPSFKCYSQILSVIHQLSGVMFWCTEARAHCASVFQLFKTSLLYYADSPWLSVNDSFRQVWSLMTSYTSSPGLPQIEGDAEIIREDSEWKRW